MRNQVDVHVNGKTYMQRIKPTLVGPVLFVSFVIAIGYLGTDSPWTLLVGVLLFSLYFVERLYWGRIYITDIVELPEGKLKINYMDRNSAKEYIGDKKDIRIQRNSVWYKMKADREQYITLKDEQKGFILKQFALGDWKESMINQLVDEWQPTVNESNLAAAS